MSSDDPRQLQWIACKDFSPGIADRDYRASGSLGPWPLGTATVDNTFGCRALPNGALGPMPLRQRSFSLPFPDDVLSGTPVNVLGLLIQGPVRDAPTTGYDEANWFVATDYKWLDGAVDIKRTFRMQRLRMWKSGPPIDTIETLTDDAADDGTGGTHRTCFMESSRADDSNPQLPGVPGMVYTWYGTDFTWSFFPDPGDTDSLTPFLISDDYKAAPMIVYQGRSLICNHFNFENGASTVHFRSNENIYYTKSNLLTLQDTVASTFTPEDPGEIMAMCVSSANELFVLKHRQGAYVIRGDINFPTVLRIPGIMGTGRMPCIPLACPIGVVYPSKNNGVYVWPGGEESINISEQMEPDRFRYDLIGGDNNGDWAYSDNGGRPIFYQDLIFVAPFWCYDYKTQAWWRLEDPEDTEAPLGYLWFQTSLSRTSVIASRAEFFAGEAFAFAYDFSRAKYSYQWRSQPIAETMNADVEVREVVLRATGDVGSTVTLNLYAFGETETHVFTLDGSDYPRELRKLSALAGGDIQVEIIADGGVDSLGAQQPAPIVYEWRLGWYETQTLPVQEDA